ncbi:MAG TPA: hypothetical protein VL749_00415 [Patescibacteria group bacterium]|nr:hypothetical protein [Patescibacteria group bacterium]
MDRGAVVAAYVGIGVAVTMAIGFLLVIPIEPIYVLLSFPAGMLIGYYANARAGRARGAWRRIVPNSLLAGAVTGLTFAALLLGTRALFFFGDSGYPDFNRTDDTGASVGMTCHAGADCVYQRYLMRDAGALSAAGVADAAAFSDVYWARQWSTAEFLVVSTTTAALLGGVLFAIAGPRGGAVASRSAALA